MENPASWVRRGDGMVYRTKAHEMSYPTGQPTWAPLVLPHLALYKAEGPGELKTPLCLNPMEKGRFSFVSIANLNPVHVLNMNLSYPNNRL